MPQGCKKINTSRKELFEKNERNALKPLRAMPYEYAIWKTTKADPNYHVLVQDCHYSVPYNFRNKKLQVRIGKDLIQIFSDTILIASHKKSTISQSWITDSAHMPEPHLMYKQKPIQDVIDKAAAVGLATKKVVMEILSHGHYREMAILSAKGLLGLCQLYDKDQVERSCQIAIDIGSPTRSSVTSILKNSITTPNLVSIEAISVPQHENLRGSSYFFGTGVK